MRFRPLAQGLASLPTAFLPGPRIRDLDLPPHGPLLAALPPHRLGPGSLAWVTTAASSLCPSGPSHLSIGPSEGAAAQPFHSAHLLKAAPGLRTVTDMALACSLSTCTLAPLPGAAGRRAQPVLWAAAGQACLPPPLLPGTFLSPPRPNRLISDPVFSQSQPRPEIRSPRWAPPPLKNLQGFPAA